MATLDDIDLYGDGLATELNVSQAISTPVNTLSVNTLSYNLMHFCE